MKIAEEVEDEIRYRVAQGFESRAGVFECIVESYAGELGGSQCSTADLDAATRGALWEAIDQAFQDKAAEMRSWPEPTDCDRLRVAFDALNAQGIVALEVPGLTQDDGIAAVAELANARDDLGTVVSHGYCFFTWNDLHRAMDGGSLSLAYGTFLESEPAASAAPPVCAVCNGRGWLAAADPSHGSTFCACQRPGAPPTLTAAPRPGPVAAVGAAVVAACRDSGLEVRWTGRPEDVIDLPDFRWQRRLHVAGDDDVRAFLDSWELEIRAGYLEPRAVLDVLRDRAEPWLGTFSDFGPTLWSRLRSHTEAFLAVEQRKEASWDDATTNDRITGAFADLERDGILANENSGLTIHDGWAYAGTNAREGHRAAVFFHHEDVIDALTGGPLLLAFGAVGVAPDDEPSATLAAGRCIVAALRRHGVTCRWSEAIEERIAIQPFAWRRRRWSTAPVYDTSAREPDRPSLLARLLGRRGSGARAATAAHTLAAPQSGVVVRANRDESGFDLRRARDMRAAWAALGHTTAAQVGHVGPPHAFVRTGEHTSLCPRLAIANLREERIPLFERGMRAHHQRLVAES